MEEIQRNSGNFKVIFSERLYFEKCSQTTSSSSSSTSSGSLFDITKSPSCNISAIPPPNQHLIITDVLSKKFKKSEDRKKEKEKKMILKFQREEAEKLYPIATSKCGRFIKYNSKIGEGGYKVVNKGFDKEACCNIAWCEVKREHVDSKEKNLAMLKEIEIMLKLDHPNIVKCFAVLKNWWVLRNDFEDKKCEVKGLVIIQEYMGAGTLKEMIKKNFQDGRCILDIRLITRWLLKILEALRYMHCRIELPIIHRDIKSENCFLVEKTGEEFVSIKIGDFGLATTINQNSQRKTMIGTVGFMAPEVFEEKYDIKVDIYAFGMMVLEVMTNKTPYYDCSNVFQVVSKSMGNHLPDVISTITQPLIKEVLLACVHPLPIFRPSAEELCEHLLFQNAPFVVEPFKKDLSRSETINNLICDLSFHDKSPIIDLAIRANKDLDQLYFNEITFSFDIYQTHNKDLYEFMSALNEYIEEHLKKCFKKMSQIKKVYESIRLQIQYIIKLINGERWRRIFEDFLQKEGGEKRSQRSNSNPSQQIILPDIKKIIATNSLNLGKNDKYTNNFADYSHKVSVYHKTTQFLTQEIEDYCRKIKEKKLPYFFNWNIVNVSENCITKDINDIKMITISLKPTMKSYHVNTTVNVPESNAANDTALQPNNDFSDLIFSPTKEASYANDEVFLLSPTKEENNNERKFVRVELLSPADIIQESTVNPSLNQSQLYVNQNSLPNNHIYSCHEQIKNINIGAENALQDRNVDMLQHTFESYDIPSISQNYVPYRHLSEPIYATNSLYQVNQVHPNLILSQGYYPNISEYYNTIRIQPQFQRVNYIQPAFVSDHSKLLLSSDNTLLFQNFTGLHEGIYYNQVHFVNPDSQFMQTNTPYIVPQDQTCKSSVSLSQPVITGSWPNIVASGPMSQDNVIVSGIYQSYVSSQANVMGTQSRSPISLVGATADVPFFLRSPIIPNSQNQAVSQKFNPPVISTARQISIRPQPSYSTVISSTKVLEKTKKKHKSRVKSKYLIKVINIQENINPAETILTFEMMLPMHQMRFTCCLINEINSLDVSNFVGEAGQIPGDLSKKDILESLVNTVKKICLCLADDINSVSLNEDYVFHPCSPNIGLIKLSECAFSIPGSLDSDNNQSCTPLNLTLNLHPLINSNSSCASSDNLSRQPSNEDVSWSMSNLSIAMPDHLCYNLTESDLILFSENDVLKPTHSALENQNKLMKSSSENESNLQSIVSSKCACPNSDSILKVPEHIFATVKQIVDKLLNLHCKGVIILPQSNDILTRNFRVLEIPAEHMFVGLPCSDSSYNVIKGQKDKDFIIARDTRDPQNVTEKCVYQKPSDGAVLLDSSGEIQYIQKPSLIIPSRPGHGNDKTDVKALPYELTHLNDRSLNCEQIVSVLQSLIKIQSTSGVRKDELFDSPVMLEPKQQIGMIEKHSVESHTRRNSDENISSQIQPQSHIQVEHLFCQYVSLPKSSEQLHDEIILSNDGYERDLPKQQIRSRKISNESLDSITSIRPRVTSTVIHGNESESLQSQTSFQKLMTNNPVNLQNSQKSFPIGNVMNQVPVQRLPNVPGALVGQYVLSNPNTAMSAGNIFLQGVQNHPLYSNCNQAPGPTVIMSQHNQSVPMVLSNQSSMSYNFPHLVPNQMVLPSGVMSQTQMSQIHQLTQTPAQRITVPSSIAPGSLSSSQLLPTKQLLQHNMLPTSQPGISTPIHPSQLSEHSMMQGSPVIDIADPSYGNNARQIQVSNVRQLPPGSSQYFDPNVINSIIADNLRIQQKNQPLNAQVLPQTTPRLLIPHQSMPPSSSSSYNHTLPVVTGTSAKMYPLASESTSIDNQHTNVQVPEVVDNKHKPEQQTIGRFVIRPVVTENTETS